MHGDIECLKLAESVSRQRDEDEDLDAFIFSMEEDVPEDTGELVGQHEEGSNAMCGTQV